MSRRGGRMSVAIIISYIFDWVVIIAAAVVGTILGNISPNKHPFSLGNPAISFPYRNDTISSAVLIIVSLVIPAGIIFLVALILVPGSTVPKSTPKSLIWKRKFWEWFTGWTGLALSLASCWLITNGLKNIVGKPRPDTIARCVPDLANLAKYALGGFPNTPQGAFLVSADICTQKDKSILDDGFRSFPSGHSSFSAGGLVYLSLFLASKLAITLPFLAPRSYSRKAGYTSAFPSRMERRTGPPRRDLTGSDAAAKVEPSEAVDSYHLPTGHDDAEIAARNQSAAPPLYLLLIAFLPTATAMCIACTRFSDFRHQGFDILSGFFIGTVTAIFAFRYYHLPLRQGAGWSWGPRSRSRAFWAGVGVGSYVGGDEEGQYSQQVDNASTVQPEYPRSGPSNTNARATDQIELLERGSRPRNPNYSFEDTRR